MSLGVFPDRTCEERHADELGQRIDGHLRHHVRAVDLDGLRAEAESRRDLLVGLPRGHQAQHLTLPRAQRCEAPARLLAAHPNLARLAVDLEGLADTVEKELVAERLLD